MSHSLPPELARGFFSELEKVAILLGAGTGAVAAGQGNRGEGALYGGAGGILGAMAGATPGALAQMARDTPKKARRGRGKISALTALGVLTGEALGGVAGGRLAKKHAQERRAKHREATKKAVREALAEQKEKKGSVEKVAISVAGPAQPGGAAFVFQLARSSQRETQRNLLRRTGKKAVKLRKKIPAPQQVPAAAK